MDMFFHARSVFSTTAPAELQLMTAGSPQLARDSRTTSCSGTQTSCELASSATSWCSDTQSRVTVLAARAAGVARPGWRIARQEAAATSHTSSRASNEGSRRFYNHREGPYKDLLLVDSSY